MSSSGVYQPKHLSDQQIQEIDSALGELAKLGFGELIIEVERGSPKWIKVTSSRPFGQGREIKFQTGPLRTDSDNP